MPSGILKLVRSRGVASPEGIGERRSAELQAQIVFGIITGLA
jgi:hypothetical protein